MFVRQSLGELGEFWVLSKKIIAVEATVFGCKGLHLAVDCVGKSFDQRLLCIAGKQAIPVTAPNEFDHIPASTAKEFFQFIDDATIATNWAI